MRTKIWILTQRFGETAGETAAKPIVGVTRAEAVRRWARTYQRTMGDPEMTMADAIDAIEDDSEFVISEETVVRAHPRSGTRGVRRHVRRH